VEAKVSSVECRVTENRTWLARTLAPPALLIVDG
jgi:hypothetical protein